MSGRISTGRTSIAASSSGSTEGGGGTEVGKLEEGGVLVWSLGLGLLPPLFFPVFPAIVGGGAIESHASAPLRLVARAGCGGGLKVGVFTVVVWVVSLAFQG
jgi:hypothetical protein